MMQKKLLLFFLVFSLVSCSGRSVREEKEGSEKQPQQISQVPDESVVEKNSKNNLTEQKKSSQNPVPESGSAEASAEYHFSMA